MAVKKTIEDMFREIDEILVKMEDKDLPLEESFRYYEKGVKLVEQAGKSLDSVEKKIIEIQGEGNV